MTTEEENIRFSKLKSEISKNATLKECILKDSNNCSGNIINAHSLQRMGVLSNLEARVDGNMGVYALTENQVNPKTNFLELVAIGKKQASTFFGFCHHHDQLFSPIENDHTILNLNLDKHCFLLSFRAFALSYHRKKEDIRLLSTQDDKLRAKIKQYYNNEDLESQLRASKLGLSDLKKDFDFLSQALENENYDELDYLTCELDHAAPIGMSMGTSPPFLFSGKSINISPDPLFDYSDIYTTVLSFSSRTCVVLATRKDRPNGIKYLDELNAMYELPFQKALTWHILTNAENCFFSPLWYNKLSNEQRSYIVELSHASHNLNTPYLKYNPKNFKLNLFDKAYAI